MHSATRSRSAREFHHHFFDHVPGGLRSNGEGGQGRTEDLGRREGCKRGGASGRRDVEKEKQGREEDGREGGQKQDKLVVRHACALARAREHSSDQQESKAPAATRFIIFYHISKASAATPLIIFYQHAQVLTATTFIICYQKI